MMDPVARKMISASVMQDHEIPTSRSSWMMIVYLTNFITLYVSCDDYGKRKIITRTIPISNQSRMNNRNEGT